jgi:hypothetical protein
MRPFIAPLSRNQLEPEFMIVFFIPFLFCTEGWRSTSLYLCTAKATAISNSDLTTEPV